MKTGKFWRDPPTTCALESGQCDPVHTGIQHHKSNTLKAVCVSPAGPRNNQSPGFHLTSHLVCQFKPFLWFSNRGLHRKQGLIAERLPEDPQMDRDSQTHLFQQQAELGLDAIWVSPFYVSVLSTECKSSSAPAVQDWQSRALHSKGREKGKEKLNLQVSVLIPPSKPDTF